MANDRILIWGTGSVADWIISQCEILDSFNIMGFIDNDSKKIGRIYKNYKIYSPDILRKEVPDRIVILSDYYEEIKHQIVECFPFVQEFVENKFFFYKEILLKRYEKNNEEEIKNILNYVKKNDLSVFNYDFINRYKSLNIDVEFDKICGMFFVYHYGKKMYFAKKYNTKEKVVKYYKDLLIEQDVDSPHRYLTSNFNVNEGDVVVDVGVAEGNFALEIIEKVSKIYLIETDDDWIEAISETFKDYKNKVNIIKKYIASMDMGKYATLDNLINEPINFLKMDIEGHEWDALIGAKKTFEASSDLKCAICAYHNDFDEVLIRDVLTKYKINYFETKGYMWYPFGQREIPKATKLCRGVLHGMRRK